MVPLINNLSDLQHRYARGALFCVSIPVFRVTRSEMASKVWSRRWWVSALMRMAIFQPQQKGVCWGQEGAEIP